MRVWHVAESLKKNTSTRILISVIPPLRNGWVFTFRRVSYALVLLWRIVFCKNAIFYVHKIASPPEIVMLFTWSARFWKRRVIYDFDDERQSPRLKKLMGSVEYLIVSSHALLEDAKKYNANVLLIPTTVPLALYKEKKRPPANHVPVIGWIGSAKGQIENLKILVPVFKALCRRGAQFHFKLIGAQGISDVYDMFFHIDGLSVDIVNDIDWSREEEIIASIDKFDIGVMPLVDNARNQRKAGFKLIQYMAIGLPVVASLVGENPFIVRDNDNGFLVRTAGEWEEALTHLLADIALRSRLGAQGAKMIEEEYALERWIEKYRSLLL
jgi:glycosyltransferase involved in cell wall biosynthesis